MKGLWVEDLDRLLDAHGHDEEEGQGVEAVDVNQFDRRPFHFHWTSLDQGQVATLSKNTQETIGVSLTIKFLVK